MELVFKSVNDFDRGTLHRLLVDGYSFDGRWQKQFEPDWIEFDSFFYDHPQIAETCAFVTTRNGEPIGHISWDPRNKPEYVIIGHNCIASRHKGNGYGRMQLQEALRRIGQGDVRKVIVTTNGKLVPAQHMYESVGFTLHQRRENNDDSAFSGEYLDYEMVLKE